MSTKYLSNGEAVVKISQRKSSGELFCSIIFLFLFLFFFEKGFFVFFVFLFVFFVFLFVFFKYEGESTPNIRFV